MASPSPEQVTIYSRQIRAGDSAAVQLLLPHVYEDLRHLAGRVFADQRQGHTLQPTALVHEAYLRLARPGAEGWNDRQAFLRVAALAMRQLLTDYARARGAQKRGSGGERVLLEDTGEPVDPTSGAAGVDLVSLHAALSDLRELDERQDDIVELRFLTGLTVQDTAEVLGVSERTVFLDWKMARAWLEQRLAD